MTSPIDVVPSLPVAIGPSIPGTFAAYVPALQAVKHLIRQPDEEKQYGPDKRQMLDVYYPPELEKGKKYPVFMFYYGGGIAVGDKNGDARVPETKGLIYANLGTWFANNGFIAVVVDYRTTTSNPDIVFPSGGEDVSLSLQWVADPANMRQEADRGSVFLAGNSAGGIHVMTFLWCEQALYKKLRDINVKVRGVLNLSAPGDVDEHDPYRDETMLQYYGPVGPIRTSKQPSTLRQQSDDATPFFSVVCEYEPEDEILRPVERFLALYDDGKVPGNPPKPQSYVAVGHSHMSMPWGCMLPDKREDAWARDMVSWMKERIVSD